MASGPLSEEPAQLVEQQQEPLPPEQPVPHSLARHSLEPEPHKSEHRLAPRTPERTPVRRSQRVEVDELGVPIATSMADNAMQFSHPTSSGGTGVNYVPEETEQRSAPRSTVQTQYRDEPKIGRNDPCPCGSGKKYKQCHGKSVA